MKIKLLASVISLGMLIIGTQASAATHPQMTNDNGSPVGDNQNSQTAGENGPVLLQDGHLIQKLQRFVRERTPERVVHARGTGAFGEFIADKDISKLTEAAVFKPGTKTPVFVRFSTVIHPKGSPEELRDPHGFAFKFYTTQGNWDLVGLDEPVFFIRDAMKFPDMIHSLKPSPVTNVQDPNRLFDFFSHQPESTHMLTRIYSFRGIPSSYRKVDGWGVHTFKLVNAQGEVTYVKFHFKSHQGNEGYNIHQAMAEQGKDFNNLTNDLYNNIAKGNHPVWDLYIQTLKPEQLDNFAYNPLDDTKEWLGVPETKIGTLTLNKVPDNFFQSTETVAFDPSNMVPGIEPSEDRMLQGRLFSYADAHMYRLGANYQQLPINRPRVAVHNYNQDGIGDQAQTDSDVNYQPSVTEGSVSDNPAYKAVQTTLSGTTQQKLISKTDNYEQAGTYYRSLTQQQQDDLIEALGGDLAKVKNIQVRQAMLSHFYKADTTYGTRLTMWTKDNIETIKALAKKLN
ncbi:catalase [Rosenbergiella epipactidis]|uniref:catalase n=1 Tax=Rosenbergiella epipactidis TaxID=1544694 RepID=UPI00240E1DB1|nr:catalase [Rosenbergiella epipactidis]